MHGATVRFIEKIRFLFCFGGIIIDREGLCVYNVAVSIETVKESPCNSHIPNFHLF